MRFVKWLLRAWPVLVPFLLVAINILLLFVFCEKRELINKSFSLFLQLVGGGAILYSIDSNFESFQKGNMILALKKYWKECPLFKQHYYLYPEPAVLKMKMGQAHSKLVRNPETLEGKLEYLQEQIEHLDNLIHASEVASNKKFDELETLIESQVSELNKAHMNTEKKIEDIVLGGVGAQVFGFFLIIHGAIAGFFA